MNLFHIKISYSDTLSNSYLLLKTQNFIQKMFTVVSNEGEIQLFSFRYPILCSKGGGPTNGEPISVWQTSIL